MVLEADASHSVDGARDKRFYYRGTENTSQALFRLCKTNTRVFGHTKISEDTRIHED